MAALTWDELDKRFYETGVSKGVLYTPTAGVYSTGVAWSGLTGVTESPTGAASNKQYADNIVYVNLLSAESFEGTIEALTFPEEFLLFDGVVETTHGAQVSMQARPPFGFCWRTEKGSAEDENAGYVLHLAYGLQASPSQKAYKTVNDTPAPVPFSWTVSSTPVSVTGMKPTALVKVDSTSSKVTPSGLAALEEALYGAAATPARLPLPDEVETLLATA